MKFNGDFFRDGACECRVFAKESDVRHERSTVRQTSYFGQKKRRDGRTPNWVPLRCSSRLRDCGLNRFARQSMAFRRFLNDDNRLTPIERSVSPPNCRDVPHMVDTRVQSDSGIGGEEAGWVAGSIAHAGPA